MALLFGLFEQTLNRMQEMSTLDTPSDNVVPLKKVVAPLAPPAPPTESVLTDTQKGVVKSIETLANFFRENALSIEHFVCVVANKTEHEGDVYTAYSTFATPITSPDFLMCIHMAQRVLNARMEGG